MVNKIDEKIIDIRKIVNHFEEFEREKDIGKEGIIRYLSKKLASIDYDILELLKTLKLSTDSFMERRKDIDMNP